MKQQFKKTLSMLSVTAVILAMFTPVFADQEYQKVDLKLMATTDLHTTFMDYNYYTDKQDDQAGFVKIATLIKQIQQEMKQNTLLFDNGDLIQGSPYGDYLARVKKTTDKDVYPMITAMNQLGYDAAAYGNHEFNYGLPYLENVVKDAKFPYLSANIIKEDGTPYAKPYVILDKQFVDDKGKEVTIKVGVIGFVPPQIMTWDSGNLSGKVKTQDIVETANKYVPQMKKEGADLIVALAHTGMGSEEPQAMTENAGYQLSKIKDIDVIVSGHSHLTFPSSAYEGIKGVNLVKGTVNGKRYNIAGALANALGIVDLQLINNNGKWKVNLSKSYVLPVYDKAEKKSLAANDPDITKIFEKDHQATLEYIRSAIGETKEPIYSYLALAQDDSSVQLVNNAQKWYVQNKIKGTDLEKLPVLSAAAPFKAGGRNGADYYTNIPKGTLAIKNMADLYVYPNTLYVMKVKGSDIKEWLEMSAGQFNQIDPAKTGEQMLVSTDFPTYNFDVIDGVTYKIDITKPAKYTAKGTIQNQDVQRIVDLMYDGKPIDMNAEFLVATNNYRGGGGGNFPGINLEKVAIQSPDESRQIIVDYIQTLKTIDSKADGNWSFVKPEKDLNIVLLSSPKAKEFIGDKYKFLGDGENGFAKYQLQW